MQDAGNRYLEGNFAPVQAESTIWDLDVEGTLPPALNGRYIRTGPNPVSADPATHHWFVGDGMLHGVDLHDGAARWYRNRWVTSPPIAAMKGLPEVPAPADTGMTFPGSGNTNVVHHAGRVFALNELSLPYEISSGLDTVRRENFGGPLPAGMNAHPKFDLATGEMHVLGYHFMPPFCRYHVIDAGGRVARTEEIAVGGPVMMHDMALTQSQVVVFDLPVVFSLEAATAGNTLPYFWDPSYRPRIGLMPRAGGGDDTVWIDVDPCYVFHPLNAYDDESGVVVDLVVHPRMFDGTNDPLASGASTLQRWFVDVAGEKVRTEIVDDHFQEFPRADERLATRRHRFGYSVGTAPKGHTPLDAATSVLKHDMAAGTTEALDPGADRVPGEFVFVPEAEDSGEDEGWLVGYVHNLAEATTDLVVLDAHDFTANATAGPVASVRIPARVPFGFHGNWIPDSAT